MIGTKKTLFAGTVGPVVAGLSPDRTLVREAPFWYFHLHGTRPAREDRGASERNDGRAEQRGLGGRLLSGPARRGRSGACAPSAPEAASARALRAALRGRAGLVGCRTLVAADCAHLCM